MTINADTQNALVEDKDFVEDCGDSSDSDEEYDFCAYDKEESYIVKITTAGGGMMNGNAYQYVELHYKNKDEWDCGENFDKAYLVEVGQNPVRMTLMGEGNIRWSEKQTDNFNLVECGC